MSLRHNTIVAAALGSLALLPACNPYQNFSGEYYAGPVDGTSFLKPYQGTLPGPAEQGGGTVTPIDAFVGGNPIFFYKFPLGAGQGADPAGMLPDAPLTVERLKDGGSLANVYVFDPQTNPANALPSPGKCNYPKDYIFDQRTEAYRGDEQGAIFNKLPTADYYPLVAEVPVTSAGQPCQDAKSAAAVKNKLDGIKPGTADGKYLAFAILDPTADVQPNDPNTHLGPIHLGFYNHYLVQFVDGGYVPTVMVPASGMDAAHTDFVTQKLYYPSKIAGTDPMTMMPAAVDNKPFTGSDILEAARGDAAYSPICEVWVYDADLDMNGLPVAKQSVGDLSDAEKKSAMATGDLAYCFQVF